MNSAMINQNMASSTAYSAPCECACNTVAVRPSAIEPSCQLSYAQVCELKRRVMRSSYAAGARLRDATVRELHNFGLYVDAIKSITGYSTGRSTVTVVPREAATGFYQVDFDPDTPPVIALILDVVLPDNVPASSLKVQAGLRPGTAQSGSNLIPLEWNFDVTGSIARIVIINGYAIVGGAGGSPRVIARADGDYIRASGLPVGSTVTVTAVDALSPEATDVISQIVG